MDELSKLVNDARENSEKILEAIQRLEDRINYLKATIERLEVKAREDEIPRRIAREMLHSTEEEAIRLLELNSANALEQTEEFNSSMFKADLLAAVRDPDTYRIKPTSNNKDVEVDIDLNRTAGSLEDYAKGVKYAREHFKGTMDAQSASNFWALFLYGAAREGKRIVTKRGKDRTEYHVALYERTIALRKMGSAKLAPWWGLVEWGNTDIDLESDRGGEPYPYYGGQYFVLKSEEQTRAFYKDTLTEYMERYHSELESELRVSWKQLNEARKELEKFLDLDHTKTEIIHQLIHQHLSKWYASSRRETITDDMLDRIAEQIISGRSPRISLGGGAPRIRTSRILQEYNRRLKEILG
jgi:hypothetical protein